MDLIIKYLYGSVDKMIEANNMTVSRAYVYQIIKGDKTNITIDVAKEFVKALNLQSIDDFVSILETSKNNKGGE